MIVQVNKKMAAKRGGKWLKGTSLNTRLERPSWWVHVRVQACGVRPRRLSKFCRETPKKRVTPERPAAFWLACSTPAGCSNPLCLIHSNGPTTAGACSQRSTAGRREGADLDANRGWSVNRQRRRVNGRAARRGVLRARVGKLGEALSAGLEGPGRDRSGGAEAAADPARRSRLRPIPCRAARSVRLAAAN